MSELLIRSVRTNDLHLIDDLCKDEDFKLPHADEDYIIDKVAYHGSSLVGYGVVKRIGEAIFVANKDCSVLMRAEAMRELMKYAELGAKRDRCKQMHCFVKNEKLAKTLIKKFGFIRADDIVLVKNL